MWISAVVEVDKDGVFFVVVSSSVLLDQVVVHAFVLKKCPQFQFCSEKSSNCRCLLGGMLKFSTKNIVRSVDSCARKVQN